MTLLTKEEEILIVEMKAQSIPALLILGILFIAIGIYLWLQGSSDSQNAFLLLGIGFVSLLIWMQTKRRVIKISSCGGAPLAIDVKQMSQEKYEEFIDKLQQAKANRIEYLFKS